MGDKYGATGPASPGSWTTRPTVIQSAQRIGPLWQSQQVTFTSVVTGLGLYDFVRPSPMLNVRPSKFGWPKIKAYFDKGMQDLQQNSDKAIQNG